MVTTYKLHKIAGLTAGVVLLILGVSGFFINHDKWSFLYNTTFSHLPEASKQADKKLFDAYHVDPNNSKHIIVGGKRGIFESFNKGKSFHKISSLQCLAIRSDASGVYAATSDGIYKVDANAAMSYIALKGEYVTSLALSQKNIVAAIDKHRFIQINKQNSEILHDTIIEIAPSQLQEPVKLSRFVRDIHYGRGLLEGDLSLFINDYGAVVLSILALSGYLIWYLIRKKKYPQFVRKLIKIHANWFVIIASFPLVILAVSGIFLDHSSGLSKFMKSVTISHSFLPPVYSTLKSDIWSLDYNEKNYRIGNRYGVYKSKDLQNWRLESRGFAYRMIRKGTNLYVSGMGAPNRLYNGIKWQKLQAPHMFRDVIKIDNKTKYFSHSTKELNTPTFKDVTLYSLLLTLHDGSFFASWWVWINDYVSVMLLILIVTGYMRFKKKKKRMFV